MLIENRIDKAAEILERLADQSLVLAKKPEYGHCADLLMREGFVYKGVAKALRGEE
jgi:hypothetical protein